VEGGKGADNARGGSGNGDTVNVVDRTASDTASGGAGSGDTCVIDRIELQLVFVEDDFDASCERVVRAVF
jgi:hypothetical protein